MEYVSHIQTDGWVWPPPPPPAEENVDRFHNASASVKTSKYVYGFPEPSTMRPINNIKINPHEFNNNKKPIEKNYANNRICTCNRKQQVKTRIAHNDNDIRGTITVNCNMLSNIDTNLISSQISALMLQLDRSKPFAESRLNQKSLKSILAIYFKVLNMIPIDWHLRLSQNQMTKPHRNHQGIRDTSLCPSTSSSQEKVIRKGKDEQSDMMVPADCSRRATLKYIENLDGYSHSTHKLRMILKSPNMIYALSAYQEIIDRVQNLV